MFKGLEGFVKSWQLEEYISSDTHSYTPHLVFVELDRDF